MAPGKTVLWVLDTLSHTLDSASNSFWNQFWIISILFGLISFWDDQTPKVPLQTPAACGIPPCQVIRRKSPSRPKKKDSGDVADVETTGGNTRVVAKLANPIWSWKLRFDWGFATLSLSDWTILSTKQHDQSTIGFGSRTSGGSKLNPNPKVTANFEYYPLVI